MRSVALLATRALSVALMLSLASRATATDPAWLSLTLAAQESERQVGAQALESTGGDAERRPIPLHFDLVLDASVTGAAGLAVLLLAVFEGQLTPTCRWCTPGPIDASIRNGVVWSNPNTADVVSTVVVTAIPISVAAYLYFSASGAGDKNAGLEDLLIGTEAVALNQVLTETVKASVARQRPWSYYGNAAAAGSPSQANLSFYGGHASMAFTAVSAGMTIGLLRGYPGAWIVGAVGYPTAALVAYLRMAADQHYFSDVLTGALVGGLVGFAIPYFFHNRNLTEPGSMRPAPGGVAFSF